MTCNAPKFATSLGRLRRLGGRLCCPPASRWMGVVLAVALFGVDAFQPVIGLVEIGQRPGQAKPVNQAGQDPQPTDVPQAVVVSIHAWQWHQSLDEFWPAFIFTPTINAGSTGGVHSARSILGGGSPAALPPCPLTESVPVPVPVVWLAAPLEANQALTAPWSRQIRPIGPPVA